MGGQRVLAPVPTAIEPSKDVQHTLIAAQPREGSYPLDHAPAISVIFRDGNGRQWIRFPTSRLRRVYLSFLYPEIYEPAASAATSEIAHLPRKATRRRRRKAPVRSRE